MMSQARWVTFTSVVVGRSSAGIVLRPLTTVEVPVLRVGQDRGEARDRQAADHLVVGVEVAEEHLRARRCSVFGTISIEANLVGWSTKTQRASASPTPICTGVAIAATVKPMMKPSRW